MKNQTYLYWDNDFGRMFDEAINRLSAEDMTNTHEEEAITDAEHKENK